MSTVIERPEGDKDPDSVVEVERRRLEFSRTKLGALVAGLVSVLLVAAFLLWGDRRDSDPNVEPQAAGEVLVLIASFGEDSGAAGQLRDALRSQAEKSSILSIRFETIPDIIPVDALDGAAAIGERYQASIIIWGDDSAGGVSTSFMHLSDTSLFRDEAGITLDQLTIERRFNEAASKGTGSTVGGPSPYLNFVVDDLTPQLTFLSFFALAHARYVSRDFDSAAQLLEESLIHSGTAPPNAVRDAYFRLGHLKYLVGDFEAAIPNYSEALGIGGPYAGILSNRGAAYGRAGNLQAALDDFNAALELDPENVAALANRGVVELNSRDLDAAMVDLNHALSVDANYIPALVNRAAVYLLLGESEDTERNLKQAIVDLDLAIGLWSPGAGDEVSPSYVRAFNNRGNAYARLGDLQSAKSDFDQAIALDPANSAAYSSRANLSMNTGDYEMALADLNRALEVDPSNAIAFYNRGIAHANLQQYDLALEDYTQAVDLIGNAPAPGLELQTVLFDRGNAYSQLGDYGSAIRDYGEAERLGLGTASLFSNRASAKLDSGDNSAAVLDASRAIAVDSEDAFAYFVRGVALGRQGDTEQARKELEIFVALADSDDELLTEARHLVADLSTGIDPFSAGQ